VRTIGRRSRVSRSTLVSALVSGWNSVNASCRELGDHDVGNWFHGLVISGAASALPSIGFRNVEWSGLAVANAISSGRLAATRTDAVSPSVSRRSRASREIAQPEIRPGLRHPS
jgi:hypothetical protein